MNIEEFRDYCLGLPGTTEETPFGPDTLVFKVGGKLFALTSLQTFASINLKCDPEQAAELRERYDYVLPGFHMNKKHWNTVLIGAGASYAQLREWITHSYELVVARTALGNEATTSSYECVIHSYEATTSSYEWITHSYELVVASLPKAVRAELASENL